jgi:hypothetical protein
MTLGDGVITAVALARRDNPVFNQDAFEFYLRFD